MTTFLTQNFRLEEFIKSTTATRLGINNNPPPKVVENLKVLCQKVLDPVRDHFKVSVKVLSGYRCLALNRAVGSKDSSDHVIGCAADIEVFGTDNKEVALWIATNLDFNQVILEYYDPAEGEDSGWVHVAYHPDGTNKKQRLIINRHGTTTF